MMPEDGMITLKVRDIYLFFAFLLVMLALTAEVVVYRHAREFHRYFWRMLIYRCVACGRFGHLGLGPLCPVVKATCFACAIVHRSIDCPVKKAKAEENEEKIKQAEEKIQQANDKIKWAAKKASEIAKKVDGKVLEQWDKEASLGDIDYLDYIHYEKLWSMDMEMEAGSDKATGGKSSMNHQVQHFDSKFTLDTVPVKQYHFS